MRKQFSEEEERRRMMEGKLYLPTGEELLRRGRLSGTAVSCELGRASRTYGEKRVREF